MIESNNHKGTVHDCFIVPDEMRWMTRRYTTYKTHKHCLIDEHTTCLILNFSPYLWQINSAEKLGFFEQQSEWNLLQWCSIYKPNCPINNLRCCFKATVCACNAGRFRIMAGLGSTMSSLNFLIFCVIVLIWLCTPEILTAACGFIVKLAKKFSRMLWNQKCDWFHNSTHYQEISPYGMGINCQKKLGVKGWHLPDTHKIT